MYRWILGAKSFMQAVMDSDFFFMPEKYKNILILCNFISRHGSRDLV